jgi:transposase
MPRLSPELRWSIIGLRKKGKSIQSIANDLRVNVKTVARWVGRFAATKDALPCKSTGRPKLLSRDQAATSLDLLMTKQHGGSGGVAKELWKQRITSKHVHGRTVLRAVHMAAKERGKRLVYWRKKPKQDLTAKNKQQRLDFAKANLRRSWLTTMFTDRKKFAFKYPGEKVAKQQWAFVGEEPTARAVSHPQVVNLYLGITVYGATAAHAVAGTSKVKSPFTTKKGQPARNITAAEYTEVLGDHLLREGQCLFSVNGISCWTFQQDNDPSHNSAASIIKRNPRGASLLLHWPPNSPDLNPIENFWDWACRKVDEKGCKTFEDYKQELISTLERPPRGLLANLIKSMPKRLAEVIRLGGSRIHY